MEVAKVRFGGIRGRPYRWGFQNASAGERQGNLKFVPTLELDPVLHGNVKAENGGARLHCEKNGTLFCDVARASRAIDCESRVATLPDHPRHLGQSTEASPGTRTARGAIAEFLNALCDRVAVAIQTGHNDDPAVAPIVCGGENSSVPKGENRAMSGVVDVVQIGIAFGFPTDGSTNNVDGKETGPSDQPRLEAIFHYRRLHGFRRL